MPPLNNTSPLTVRLQSPNQAEERTILTMQPNQRRELFAKRPELFALAPAAKPVPLKDKLPLSKLEEDIEFDVDFLRGKAFRNLSAAEVKKLGSVRPGNIDTDIFRNGNMVSKGMVRFVAKSKDENANACISPALFQQLGVKPNFISPKGLELLKAQQNTGNAATSGASSAPRKCSRSWLPPLAPCSSRNATRSPAPTPLSSTRSPASSPSSPSPLGP
jgi:hypothetical protein